MNLNISEALPPVSNTGVVNTNIVLDYLSFTVPFEQANFDKLHSLFDKADVNVLTYGGMGYQSSATILDGGKMFWHSERREMGIHVRLNPKSLGMIATTPIGMLNIIYDLKGKITRFDLAFDDRSGLLNLDEIHEKILAGDVVTRWRKVSRISGAGVGTSRKTGDTVNVGTRQSDAFLRIYDKKLERETKGVDVSNIEWWVRVELELKGDKANEFSSILAQTAFGKSQKSAGQLCASLLWGMIDFKDRDQSDTNKSRWPTSSFWRKFVGQASKMKLSIVEHEKTIDDSKEWIDKIVGPTLAMIMLTVLDDDGNSGYDFIMDCIKRGENRMTKEQQMRLQLYNNRDRDNSQETTLPN